MELRAWQWPSVEVRTVSGHHTCLSYLQYLGGRAQIQVKAESTQKWLC